METGDFFSLRTEKLGSLYIIYDYYYVEFFFFVIDV